jgi:hypothetical protein
VPAERGGDAGLELDPGGHGMIGGSWVFILPMVLSGVLGALGTLLTQWINARNQRRTTAGTVETSSANELWLQTKWTIERQDKVIDAQTKRIDELVTTIQRLQLELDRERAKNEELVEKVHLQELEMMRLRAGQAVAAAVATPVKVTVETPVPTPPQPVADARGSLEHETGGRD